MSELIYVLNPFIQLKENGGIKTNKLNIDLKPLKPLEPITKDIKKKQPGIKEKNKK
jgi:hypothetical protein